MRKLNKKRGELKGNVRIVNCKFTRTSIFIKLTNLEIFVKMLNLNLIIPSSELSRIADSCFRLAMSF